VTELEPRFLEQQQHREVAAAVRLQRARPRRGLGPPLASPSRSALAVQIAMYRTFGRPPDHTARANRTAVRAGVVEWPGTSVSQIAAAKRVNHPLVRALARRSREDEVIEERPVDPPTVEEIVAVMHTVGVRINEQAWQAGCNVAAGAGRSQLRLRRYLAHRLPRRSAQAHVPALVLDGTADGILPIHRRGRRAAGGSATFVS